MLNAILVRSSGVTTESFKFALIRHLQSSLWDQEWGWSCLRWVLMMDGAHALLRWVSEPLHLAPQHLCSSEEDGTVILEEELASLVSLSAPL